MYVRFLVAERDPYSLCISEHLFRRASICQKTSQWSPLFHLGRAFPDRTSFQSDFSVEKLKRTRIPDHGYEIGIGRALPQELREFQRNQLLA